MSKGWGVRGRVAPLHADVTAFLFAQSADPLRPCSAVEKAEIRGYWLAAEIMRPGAMSVMRETMPT
jgi:hypothetical protein